MKTFSTPCLFIYTFLSNTGSYLSVILLHSVVKAKERDDAFRGAGWYWGLDIAEEGLFHVVTWEGSWRELPMWMVKQRRSMFDIDVQQLCNLCRVD